MKKSDAKEIIKILKETYPEATCSLDFKNPFEMAIAVMLSAQCTDERVNKVTPKLFKKYPDPYKMSKAPIKDIEKLIYSCGFYKSKSKHIKECSQMLVDKYEGQVPNTMGELQSLPGIGRKSANVIMLEAFHNPQGIAVDTHVKRISNRIGLSKESDPEKIEKDLLHKIPKEYYYDANHLGVWHGRYTCNSRKPKCSECTIKQYCNYYEKSTSLGKEGNG